MLNTVVNKALTHVVVGIIQHSENQTYLISKRQEGQHLAGYWEFPGGKVEQHESLLDALKRELKEEVGIQVLSARPFKTITHHYENKSVCLHFWKITKFNNMPKANEGQQLKWVDQAALSEYSFPEANTHIISSLELPEQWQISANCDMRNVDDFLESIQNSLKKYSVKQLLFRSKQLNDFDYECVYKQLNILCAQYDCHLIANRHQMSRQLNYDSWHLTSQQLFTFQQRPLQKPVFISASCHTLSDIKQAEKLQLNCILLSPVNETSSHENAKVLGWEAFKQLADQTFLPVYALGGVGVEDVALAQRYGAIGIAAISAFKVRSELA